MNMGSSFTVKAGEAGSVISYHCVLHSRMKGKIVVDPPPPLPAVTGITLSPATARIGGSYAVTFAGSNLTAQTYFDIRFRAPGAASDEVVLNWQRGISGSHTIPAGTAPGMWTFTGARAHEDEADHSGTFTAVSVVLTVPSF
jgi:hypothetical protein